jgi:hypothetical protein
MRSAAAGLLVALGSCSPAALPADPAATLNPLTFFAGRSSGSGTLDTVIAFPVPLRVRSSGTRASPDGLKLEQLIAEGTKAPRRRTWIMRRTAPGRFTGTLTEAVGPVAITIAGPRATIRYTMKDGFAVEQSLALQPGGRTLLNDLRVRKFGIEVARVEETIRKLD